MWYRDPVGGVLVGGGVAGIVAGAILFRSATSDIDAAESATNYGASEDLVSRASSRRTIAAVVGVTGGALIAAGVVRYVLVRRGERRTLAVVPAHGGAIVGFGGRW